MFVKERTRLSTERDDLPPRSYFIEEDWHVLNELQRRNVSRGLYSLPRKMMCVLQTGA
jgi:hypothetical protein